MNIQNIQKTESKRATENTLLSPTPIKKRRIIPRKYLGNVQEIDKTKKIELTGNKKCKILIIFKIFFKF
jgi:hypothetical protein